MSGIGETLHAPYIQGVSRYAWRFALLAWICHGTAAFAAQKALAPSHYDSPAVPIRMATPDYPRTAIHARMEGRTIVCFTVNGSGKVVDAVVIESSHDVFHKPSLKAARQSSFKPAQLGRKTVPTDYCRTYYFRLEQLR